MARLRIAVCVFALAWPVGAADARDTMPLSVPRIRPLGGWSAELVARGLDRSPTFRALVDRLGRADVIVYIEVAPRRGDLPDGRTRLIGASPSFRFLLVTLSQHLTATELVALLGHELHHAVEIAGAPHVRDADAFRQYYQRHGTHGSRPDCYDTEGARQAGRRVREELALPPS